jgi:threonine synthase
MEVLRIIRESGGMALAVAEKDIHRTLSEIWQEKRWWLCPEGAACLAAIPELLDHGMIWPGANVVAFNTGSLEKYLPDLRHLL